MTKGVSNVTGRDDPLLQNVIRSRKNKDLFTFWSAVWEDLTTVKSPGSVPKAIPGRIIPAGCERQEPFGGLIGENKGFMMQVTETLNSGLKREIKITVPAGDMEAKLMARLSDCLLYTSPSPRDGLLSRMPSSA